jgi:hypothetical protein
MNNLEQNENINNHIKENVLPTINRSSLDKSLKSFRNSSFR